MLGLQQEISVLVKYMDGSTLEGATSDLGNKKYFHVTSARGGEHRVCCDDLKVVFFLKSKGQIIGQAERSGNKMVFCFFDGEILAGQVANYRVDQKRFTCFPLDEQADYYRLIINRRAIKSFHMLDPGYGEDQCSTPIVPRPPERDQLILQDLATRTVYGVALDIYRAGGKIDPEASAKHVELLLSRLKTIFKQYQQNNSLESWRAFLANLTNEIQLFFGEKTENCIRAVLQAMYAAQAQSMSKH